MGADDIGLVIILGLDPQETLPAELSGGPQRPRPESPRLMDGVGRYSLLERIGSGGMGVVYSAYDPELDRRVAVKLLHARDEEANASLLHEARTLARLSHPNVLTVHDVGTASGRVFVATEFVEGPNLAQWLEGLARPLGSQRQRVIEVFADAGRGLAAAHGSDLVHRDFKPHNVLMSEDGRPKVADFGLALPLGVPQTNGVSTADSVSGPTEPASGLSPRGTPAYMAPEVLAGETAGPRSDQFSFCVALFEALYGERPFQGTTIHALALAISSGEMTQMDASSDVPRWLHRILMRGLSQEPDDRWPTMDALVEALEHDPDRARRRRLAIGGSLLGMTVLGVALGANLGTDEEQCAGGRALLEPVWNEARAESISSALLASGLRFAPETAELVRERLDSHAARWVDMHRDACVRHLSGEQSGEMLDRRMACLERHKLEFDALVSDLERTGRQSAADAGSAVADLDPLDRCADLAALQSQVPLPNPAEASRVADLEQGAAAVAAKLRLGRPAEALELVDGLLVSAEDLEYLPTAARLHLLRGTAANRLEHSSDAAESLERAWRLALRSDDDELGAQALIALVKVVGGGLQNFDIAHARTGDARALLEELARRDEAVAQMHEAELEQALATIAWRQDDFDKAQRHVRRALDLLERHASADSPRIGSAYKLYGNVMLSAGQPELAIEYGEKSLAIMERTYGPRHPNVAAVQDGLSVVLKNAKKPHEAVKYSTSAVAILRESGTPAALARAELNFGSALTRAKRWQDAIDVLGPYVDPDLAEVRSNVVIDDRRFNYASALSKVGRSQDAVRIQRLVIEAATSRGDRRRAGRGAPYLVRFGPGAEQHDAVVETLERALAEMTTEPAAESRYRVPVEFALTMALSARDAAGDRVRARALGADCKKSLAEGVEGISEASAQRMASELDETLATR